MYNYRSFKIPYDRGIEIDQEVDAEIKKKQHTELSGLTKRSELLRVWKWLGFNFILEYISGSILLFVVGLPLFVGIAMIDSVCKRQVFKDSTLQKLTGRFFPDEKKYIKKKMSKKNYMIPANCIDCPISVKQRLFDEVEHNCFTIKRVGNQMFVFDSKKVEPRDFLYTTKEEIYFKEQLAENKWYNIVDIITDVEVAYGV